MSLLGESASGYRPGYELAAERILEMIVEQELRPGDRLPTEQELADRFGLSRSVTREAVKVLAAMGRVSAQRGRGLYVGSGTTAAQPNMPGRIEQVEQLLEFRMVQEVFAAEEAARKATPPDLNLLSAALGDCDRALAADDRALWEEGDTRFHLGIAKASGNNFVRAALESVRQLQQQVVLLALHGGSGGSLEAAQNEHAEILSAIRGGRPEEAADATRRHLRHTIDGYRDEIASIIAPTHVE
jgi:GntR family transcriptional repressor for pyruvate dehydrogenase complex